MVDTIFIVSGFVAVFFIGYAVGVVRSTPELPTCCRTCLCDHDSYHHQHLSSYGVCCDHYGCASLRNQLTAANTEKNYWISRARELEIHISDYRNMPYQEMWFRTVGDKESAIRKVNESLKPLEELKKILEA